MIPTSEFPSPYRVIYFITLPNATFWRWLTKFSFRPLTGLSISLLRSQKGGQRDDRFRPLTGLSISLPLPLKVQYLCGLSTCFAAEKKNLGFFEDFFAFSRKATFCFALMHLSPILNHAACAHLHQLIIISGAFYHMWWNAFLGILIISILIRESWTCNRWTSLFRSPFGGI